jgi:hypothetical protein
MKPYQTTKLLNLRESAVDITYDVTMAGYCGC